MIFYLKHILILTLLFSSCSSDESRVEEIPIEQQTASLTDIELVETVQEDVLKYFVDYAHPNSMLARERLHEDDLQFDQNTVTTGGSGFGFLTILMGIENQYITRTQGISQIETALNFLENADRFHGAWSHWMNGTTGEVIPFSALDNGGDLVETAFLCQALICVREYFKNGTTREQELAQTADELWKGVEWDWYTRGEEVLYWHWSPEFEWQINFQLSGYNEALIAYILAASSPTHPITAEVYHNGWARNGSILSGATRYNIPVIFNHNGANDNVGPLFWAQYSYLALDPRGLTDRYANYWDVVNNHTEIIYQHCIQNPNGYAGYNENSWGLTASYSRNTDGSTGYSAHQPNNDLGVISPTAALSSIPYSPTESLDFLRFLYEERQDEYIGIAGPYDAFSEQYQWKTQRYLAIDQGPIGPMMENYKTQLFWDLFMNAPEIRQGLISLEFSSTQHGF